MYDNIGRLQSKSLHSSVTNKLTYAYNVRSWLTGVSKMLLNSQTGKILFSDI